MQTTSRPKTRAQHLRRGLALVAALATAAFAYQVFVNDLSAKMFAIWAWVGVTALAPLLLLRRSSFAAQVLGRALLWANLVLGTFLAVVAASQSTTGALGMQIASGLALMLLGSAELATPAPGSRFAPVALRGTLVAILVMALADTTTLLFWGGVATEASAVLTGGFMLGAGAVMGLAVFGLCRMRTWGFLLNLVANIVIATAAWLLEMPDGLRVCLTATAVGQLLCGAPVLRALLVGGESAAPMNARRLSWIGSTLIAMLVLGTLAYRLVVPCTGCCC